MDIESLQVSRERSEKLLFFFLVKSFRYKLTVQQNMNKATDMLCCMFINNVVLMTTTFAGDL